MDDPTTSRQWRVSEAEAGLRADRSLGASLGIPRSRARRWILAGQIRLARGPLKPSTILGEGDVLEIYPPPMADPRLDPEEGPLNVLFEDESITVLDKPADLSVHPGAGRPRGTLANRLLDRYPQIAAIGGPGRPGIVHRLDKDTTGAMVIALSDHAYQQLSRAFAEREVQKTYLAIVYGVPKEEEGRIELPIGRHPRERKQMTVLSHGRPALTLYRTEAAAAGLALLSLDLHTGRTHQIRVHLKAIGHPLVGDPVYGEARWRGHLPSSRRRLSTFPRPALHAWALGFRHPASGEPARFQAPVPEDMRLLWEEATGTSWPLPGALPPTS